MILQPIFRCVGNEVMQIQCPCLGTGLCGEGVVPYEIGTSYLLAQLSGGNTWKNYAMSLAHGKCVLEEGGHVSFFKINN